jgi:hypothetical protein
MADRFSCIKHTHLYLEAQCNNFKFKIIVDTGAQSSVMEHTMSKLLDLWIDTSVKGEAEGVGKTKILGIVRNTHFQLGGLHVPIDFQIIENPCTDLVLLGLDFLHDHACKIDIIGRTITIDNVDYRFLNEYEVKKLAAPYDTKNEKITKLYREMINELPFDRQLPLKNILSQIAKNIIEHPLEEKYKSISVKHKVIEETIKVSPKFLPFLNNIGFVRRDDKLKFIEPVQTLVYAEKLLTA